MPFPFGKAITYTFYAVADDAYEDLSAVTAPEAIYVYDSTHKPSREDGAVGTNNGGLLETVSTWSDTSDGQGKQFTIAAIDDPEPNGSLDKRTYWLAINFKYSAAEQTQTVIRALPMARTGAHHKVVGTLPADLQAIFEQVGDYASEAAQGAKISLAKSLLEQDLEASGFQWALIWRLDDLNTAVAFKALQLIMLEQVVGGDPAMLRRHDEYKAAYDALIKSVRIEYDSTNSGAPTTIEKKGSFLRLVV